MFNARYWLAAASLIGCQSLVFGADTGAGIASLSPALQASVSKLSSEDFSTREKALKSLEQAMGEQMTATFLSNDKTLSQANALLLFQQGFANFVNHVISLPQSDQQRIFDFGFQSDHIPLMAKVYSADVHVRVDGIHRLGSIPGPEADMLLASLLGETERHVYLAALEAVWDRPATPVLIEPVWHRAVGDVQSLSGQGYISNSIALTFRGQPLQMIYDSSSYMRTLDGDCASEVLIHWKSPIVEKRVVEFFAALDAMAAQKTMNRSVIISTSNTQMKDLVSLAIGYQSKAVLPELVPLFTGPVTQSFAVYLPNQNAQAVRPVFTNRTTALVLFIQLIGQDPATYARDIGNSGWGKWGFNSADAEGEVVKKMADWWEANKAAVMSGAPTTLPTATSQPG